MKILILFGLMLLISGCATTSGPSEHDDFAQYLTSEGIAMAGTDWCSHCKDQKALFGDSFQYVDFKNCDNEQSWCVDHGVQGYPTWVFPDGQLYPGTRSIEELKSLSNYDG